MESTNWDNEIWNVIDSYFKNTDNYLSRNQIESYNTFLNINIPKTIRQFNPIAVPYAKQENGTYLFEVEITVGGSIDATGQIINDGAGIYIGKPIIQEIKKGDDGDNYVYQKILFPNEARLKNLTYKTEIQADVYVKMITNDGLNSPPIIKTFLKVPLGNIPIMLQSKICSLYASKNETLRLMGECQYDQGGYFIIDGKEKVIVAQERQVENKIYITYDPDDNNRYKYSASIRSAPENKFQPARITQVHSLYKRKGRAVSELIQEDAIRVIIPCIDGEIPLFILMRALGINSDQDILTIIVNELDTKLGENMLNILIPTINEGNAVNNQLLALEFLESKISSQMIKTNVSKSVSRAYLTDILKI